MREEIGFWVAVGLVAVAAVAIFKLGSQTEIGQKVPGYEPLAKFITG